MFSAIEQFHLPWCQERTRHNTPHWETKTLGNQSFVSFIVAKFESCAYSSPRVAIVIAQLKFLADWFCSTWMSH